MGLDPTLMCSYKRRKSVHRDRHAHREPPREGEGRDWDDVSTSRRVQKMATNQQTLGQNLETNSPSQSPEGTKQVGTLTSDF